MDLYIKATKEELVEILEILGFEVTKKDKYVDAKLNQPGGRLHAMFARIGDRFIAIYIMTIQSIGGLSVWIIRESQKSFLREI